MKKSEIPNGQLAVLNEFMTLKRNKGAICDSLSCSNCILNNYNIDGLYDSEGDECISLCNAIDYIYDTIDDMRIS
jgi:hypothetical protein